jgi:hypothetical protein
MALLLRLEPRVCHHALIEMRGIRPHVLAHSQVAHGVCDDVTLHDHDSVLGHRPKMRLTVVPMKI